MMELLSPAGSPEAVIAAVQNGADAVYMGLNDFNARRGAKNFTDEEFALLEKACRLHTTKHRTGNITVDICFDADRLDLARVGLDPNPKLMATSMGAHYAPYFGQ